MSEIEVYNKDCLKGMKDLDSGSVDLIITSPPYNLGNDHHLGSEDMPKGRSIEIFYDDDKPEEEYQEWQKEILNECYRLLKEDGSMIYNHKNRIVDGRTITPYEWILDTNFILKQEIIWVNRGQNFEKIRFYPWTEKLFWLVKDTDTKLKNVISKPNFFDWNDWPPVGRNEYHNRAFPEEMIRDILKVFPDAKRVLDPFMGRGTVGRVCKEMDRKFIGFEIVEKYYKNALEYIEEAEKRVESLEVFT